MSRNRGSNPNDLQHLKGSSESPPPAQSPLLSVTDIHSQPMTATASTSSDFAGHESSEGQTTAAPYGTRSRNRTGGPRPNYAEDKEVDLEFEANGKSFKSAAPKKYAFAETQAFEAFENERNTNPTPRSGFAASNGNHTLGNSNAQNPKDSFPGTSSFSANPNQNGPPSAPSRKRKQPGSNITTSTSTSAVSYTAPSKARGSGASYARRHHETNMMTFEGCGARLTANGELRADDGTVLVVNDHAYFICEPPGEPYYLARIMQFLPADNEPGAMIDSVRVNWYYRPKDILRKAQDTRVVFSSMHSDTCPLTSLRGKCNISHVSDIYNLDEYRVQKDSFWFDKLFDRYMHRYYEVIPTNKVINVPKHVKKVLDERWKYVLVEIGRGKELTSAVKTCKKCSSYAASHDSVDCAVCKNTHHMSCIKPPLLKKPARGFAWACAACSRAQERKLEARHTPSLNDGHATGEDDILDDEDDDHARESGSSLSPEGLPHPPATAEQIAQANLWPYRYLGVHCRVEDALDYDDRIYPRASSRLGPRHQANVNVWHGRPVEMVKPSEIKRKYIKTAPHKNWGKPAKETAATQEADKDNKLKRPKWVMDEPMGYVPRGEDSLVDIKGKKEHTAHVIFKMPDPPPSSSRGGDEDESTPDPDERERLVDEYMQRVKPIAKQYNVLDCSTNFLTKAIEKLYEHHYNAEKALAAMKNLNLRNDLKEPDLNREEIKRFEEGVMRYGSELHSVARHVGTHVKESRIVRFYYMWKKTERGRQIWGGYEGRKSKKESKKHEENKQKDGNAVKLLDDVADDQDDSAFDTGKAADKKRGFVCKFCDTRSSRQWRRAPGTAPGTLVHRDPASKNPKDKGSGLTLALCGKCAYLWRRYAIQFESLEEVSKKIAAAGARASKRRIDEELMRTIVEAQQESGDTISTTTAAAVASAGVEVPSAIIQTQEPSKKKARSETHSHAVTPDSIPEKKKLGPERPPEPAPLKPEPPRVKILACAVCYLIDLPGDELLNCRDCRLAVHRSCYGVHPERNTKKWFCDMCSNDRNTMVSTTYECVLCPVKSTAHELMEPPKVSHKKKTDREREKERKEKEMVEEAVRLYRHQQEAAGRPANPREALKRTAWNNWMHVTCAIWTPEIKFGTAELLEPAEGVGFIPPDRYEVVCKICKTSGMPTVSCHLQSCNNQFHVGCAHQENYLFGFDVVPVKSTRRDVVNSVKLGEEIGVATAAIWCLNHTIPTIVHNMLEATDQGITALQLYARTFKQVDESTTGTVRRAAQFAHASVATQALASAANRRASTINGVAAAPNPQIEKIVNRSSRTSPAESPPKSADDPQAEPESMDLSSDKLDEAKKCYDCGLEFSPKWWSTQKQEKINASKKSASPEGSHSLSNSVGGDEEGRPGGTSLAPANQRRSPSVGAPSSDRVPTPVVNGSSTTNGHFKREATPGLVAETADSDQTDTALYQCHKCHVRKRSARPASPESPRSRVSVEAQAPAPTSSSPEPLSSRAPHSRPHSRSHSHIPPTSSDSPHSHPPLPAPVPVARPQGQTHPPHNAHRRMDSSIPLTNGVSHPQSNGLPPAPAFPSSTVPLANGYATPPPPPPAASHAHGPSQPFPLPNEVSTPFHPPPNGQPPRPPNRYPGSPSPQNMRNGALTSPPSGPGPARPFSTAPMELPANLARNPSIDGPRPATPAELDRPGRSRGFSGASASPNLRNLLS